MVLGKCRPQDPKERQGDGGLSFQNLLSLSFFLIATRRKRLVKPPAWSHLRSYSQVPLSPSGSEGL